MTKRRRYSIDRRGVLSRRSLLGLRFAIARIRTTEANPNRTATRAGRDRVAEEWLAERLANSSHWPIAWDA